MTSSTSSFSIRPAGPTAPESCPPWPGIEHEGTQRRAGLSLTGRHFLRPVEIEHQAGRIGQRRDPQLGRAALEDHPQQGIGARPFQPRVVHEPVVDRLDLRLAGQSD